MTMYGLPFKSLFISAKFRTRQNKTANRHITNFLLTSFWRKPTLGFGTFQLFFNFSTCAPYSGAVFPADQHGIQGGKKYMSSFP